MSSAKKQKSDLTLKVETMGGARLSRVSDDSSTSSQSTLPVVVSTRPVVLSSSYLNDTTDGTDVSDQLRSLSVTETSTSTNEDIFTDEPVFEGRNKQFQDMLKRAHVLRPVSSSLSTRTLRVMDSNLSMKASSPLVRERDPQDIFEAAACLFVANLPENVEDIALEAEVTRVFSHWGQVFVKLRRDDNMPYAFVQYKRAEEAREALNQGRGVHVFGRPCRVELTKSTRSYVMSNRHGADVTVDEARSVLEEYTVLASIHEASHAEAASLGIRQGVIFKVSGHDSSRDVVGAFRYNDTYLVVKNPPTKSRRGNREEDDVDFLRRYDADRRSIYIGNLPADLKNLENLVRDHFSTYGIIQKLQIVVKDPRPGYVTTAFAFVEYANAEMAHDAVRLMSGKTLWDSAVKVEPKMGSHLHQMRSRPSIRDVGGNGFGSPMRMIGGMGTPRQMHHQKSQQMHQQMPQHMSQQMPQQMSQQMPQQMPQQMSQQMSQQMPQQMPQQMSYQMPSQGPCTPSQHHGYYNAYQPHTPGFLHKTPSLTPVAMGPVGTALAVVNPADPNFLQHMMELHTTAIEQQKQESQIGTQAQLHLTPNGNASNGHGIGQFNGYNTDGRMPDYATGYSAGNSLFQPNGYAGVSQQGPTTDATNGPPSGHTHGRNNGPKKVETPSRRGNHAGHPTPRRNGNQNGQGSGGGNLGGRNSGARRYPGGKGGGKYGAGSDAKTGRSK